MNKLGVIHGRFQCLHKEHMKYLLEGMSRCEHLIIGITNYNIFETKEVDATDTNRLKTTSNPFTFYERMIMIKNSMIEYGIEQSKFDIVPFPIENPSDIPNYVPINAVFFVTIYDEWGRKKLSVLKDMNLDVDVMWEKNINEKIMSGSMVRDLIRNNEEWKHLVPNAVYEYIMKNGLVERIKGCDKRN